MIGGKILDFNAMTDDNDKLIPVKFLVNGTGCESNDTVCVMAYIPKTVLPEIKNGDSIWWHNPNIYLNVFGCADVPFKKIGYSGGNAKTFYTEKSKTDEDSLL